MTHELVALISQYGLLIVALNVLLDQIGLPLPAVPTLVVAGAMAADGALPLGPLLLVSMAGCLLPDCAWYLLGQVYGMRVLKTLCRISLEPDSCVSQTQSRFERWGINSLVIAKFVPGLAIIAPPLAGAMRIGWTRFVALSTASAFLWSGLALGAGALFQPQIDALLGRMDRIGNLVAGTLAALLAAYVGFKWWERRRFYAVLRMARISVEELYEMIQAAAPKPLIIDVRGTTARALDGRKIPGALHVPLTEVGDHLAELPRDREIIVYCTCPNEASAARVAKILMNHGFKRVRPLHGGLDAWVAKGYAVERTADPAP